MILRNLIDRALVKLIRDDPGSKLLRDRFRRLYGIEVGQYSFGAFDRWRIPPGTRIGRYCSFAPTARIIDADHPIDALSTHPLFYLKDWGLVDENHAPPAPTIVEDDVWLSHHATIMPKCKHVGRGSVIGAGAVVTRDVPRYAIMVGSPARLVRYRFAPDVIEAIEATRWWELDRDALKLAASKAPGFLLAPTVENAHAFIAALGRPVPADPT